MEVHPASGLLFPLHATTLTRCLLLVVQGADASTSAASLPSIQISGGGANVSCGALGVGRRRRFRNHVACQTNSTDLADVRAMQEKFEMMRDELSSVKYELERQQQVLR